MSLSRLVRALVLFVVLLAGSGAYGQWATVHTFGSTISCVKFLGDIGIPQIGFVGAGSFVYRTQDAGSTWSNVLRIPGGSASAFCFKDGQLGWCSVYGVRTGTACYRTNDGGRNWQPLAPIGEGCDVYYNATQRLLMLSIRTGVVMVSTDDGSSWTSYSAGMNGFAFGGSYGICSTISSTFGGSTDGGQTWTESLPGLHSWAPCWVPGSTRFFAPADVTSNVYRSDNLGQSWVPSGRVSGGLTGCAQATKCAAYVQTSTGMYVSTNLTSWSYMLGSPGNVYDTRFCLSDREVWAGDDAGHLMRTTASTTTWPTLYFESVPKAISVPAGCEIDTLSAIFRNLTCSAVTIVSAMLTDSSVWHLRPVSLPIFVGSADSIVLSLTSDPPVGGIYTSTLKLRLANANGITDTSIDLRVDASRFRTPRIDSLALKGVQCTPIDTIIRIRNLHCDTIRLDAVTILDSSLIDIPGFVTPVVIPPDSELAIPVRFSTGGTGNYVAKIDLRLTYGTIVLDTIITVRATVSFAQPSATLSTRVLSFDTISTCQQAERTIQITNTTCDVVTLSELNLIADPEITLVSPKVPFAFGPGETVNVVIHLAPRRVSTPSGQLDIMLQNGTVEKYYEAAILATVVEPRHGYAFMPSDIVADSLSPCFGFDTTLVLRMLSECDSTMIERVSSDGAVQISTDKSLPALLHGTDSIVVFVRRDPSDVPTDATVRIQGPQFDSSIALHISFRADVADHLKLTADKSDFVLHRCDVDSAIIDLAAFGCSVVKIDSIGIDASPAVWLSSDALPDSVVTGEHAAIRVYVEGAEPGSYTVRVYVVDSYGEVRTVPITVRVLPLDSTALSLRLLQSPGAGVVAGTSITSEVYFTKGVSAATNLTELQCVLSFDRDVLGESAVTGMSGWSATVVSTTANSLEIECTRSTPTDIAPGDGLFRVQHRATVSRQLSTPIRLSSTRLMPNVLNYSDCILAANIDTSVSTVPLLYDCGDSLFARYLSGEPILSNVTIRPSPARDNVVISFMTAAPGVVTLTVIDLAGREALTKRLNSAKGKNTESLDLSDVPSGSYTLVLRTPNYHVSSPILIQR